jgi:metal-dependent amidase/aminoacylase/carboxypeptidase family protein
MVQPAMTNNTTANLNTDSDPVTITVFRRIRPGREAEYEDWIRGIPELSCGTIGDEAFSLATLTHVNLGEPTFGIAPAEGELRVTLRSMTNERMDALMQEALYRVEKNAQGLSVDILWHDVFRAVVNDVEATNIARNAATALGQRCLEMPTPMRWSEDFGRLGDDGAKAALLYLGAGENHPQLHNPDYDFPDALIPVAVDLFCQILRDILSPEIQ